MLNQQDANQQMHQAFNEMAQALRETRMAVSQNLNNKPSVIQPAQATTVSDAKTKPLRMLKLAQQGKERYIFVRLQGPREADIYVFMDALQELGINKKRLGPISFNCEKNYWLICICVDSVPLMISMCGGENNLHIRELPPKTEEWTRAREVAQEFLDKRIMNYSARRFCFALINANEKALQNVHKWFFVPRKLAQQQAEKPQQPEYHTPNYEMPGEINKSQFYLFFKDFNLSNKTEFKIKPATELKYKINYKIFFEYHTTSYRKWLEYSDASVHLILINFNPEEV